MLHRERECSSTTAYNVCIQKCMQSVAFQPIPVTYSRSGGGRMVNLYVFLWNKPSSKFLENSPSPLPGVVLSLEGLSLVTKSYHEILTFFFFFKDEFFTHRGAWIMKILVEKHSVSAPALILFRNSFLKAVEHAILKKLPNWF